MVGTAIVLVAGGLGLGLGFAMVTGDGAAVGRYLEAMLPYLAPVLLLGAVARLLHGVVPRLAFLAWVGLAFCVVVMFFGELLRFPPAVVDVSPFSHLALAPAEDVRVAAGRRGRPRGARAQRRGPARLPPPRRHHLLEHSFDYG